MKKLIDKLLGKKSSTRKGGAKKSADSKRPASRNSPKATRDPVTGKRLRRDDE